MAGVSKSVVEWLRRTPADADGVAELLARVAVGPPVRRGDTLLTAPVIVAHCVLHHSFTFLDRDAQPLGSAAWKGGVCDVLHADGRPELSVRPIGSWRRFGGWA